MDDSLMFTCDVYEYGTVRFLLSYKAYLVPSKGDLIFSTDDDTYAKDLKVKRVRAFPNVADYFDVLVEIPEGN